MAGCDELTPYAVLRELKTRLVETMASGNVTYVVDSLMKQHGIKSVEFFSDGRTVIHLTSLSVLSVEISSRPEDVRRVEGGYTIDLLGTTVVFH